MVAIWRERGRDQHLMIAELVCQSSLASQYKETFNVEGAPQTKRPLPLSGGGIKGGGHCSDGLAESGD
jgi:hypothetical protein